MPEEDAEKILDRIDRRYKLGMYTELFGKLGQYVSLLTGIYEVIKDEPKTEKIVLSGLVFLASSFFSLVGKGLRDTSMRELFLRDLERKLKNKK